METTRRDAWLGLNSRTIRVISRRSALRRSEPSYRVATAFGILGSFATVVSPYTRPLPANAAKTIRTDTKERKKPASFAARNSPLRLTLDYDLAFYDQTGKKYISTAFRQPMVDMVLIEAKGPPGCEQDVREFLYPLAPRISPFSKYSHGCHHLGLVHD